MARSLSDSTTLIAVLFLLGIARADDYFRTATFGSMNFHPDMKDDLGSNSTGGLVAGWILYGIALFFGVILIVVETI